ncbi:type II toxin-antitoxin system VapC family toxin [Pseudomonas sp. MWU13-2100]|uniref:type II toxin-antitoxin system VapC family toxin n=1 Tax=Pseudomonas sp. MWU13-2100 TaxID=2935075 RepID=UPI00200E3A1B|nr:type II toxin-antitoxin system VapC family toxin [Pseudomonas sp. MWU13-2100]
MIILDTNVLSEIMRPVPATGVMKWLQMQPRASMFTTTMTRGEILYGVRLMPEGARRDRLWDIALDIFNIDFAGRLLGFDSDAADAFAEISASRRHAGSPISQFDAMIAAMACSRGAILATRNIKDFIGCGVDVVNPWDC